MSNKLNEDKSVQKQRGEASVGFIILCFLFLGIPLGVVNISNSLFHRHDYTGVVQSSGNRIKLNSGENGGTSGTERFSFVLLVGDKKETMNCDDTRCASIEKNNNVTLNCYEEVHLWSPNELECRFKSQN